MRPFNFEKPYFLASNQGLPGLFFLLVTANQPTFATYEASPKLSTIGSTKISFDGVYWSSIHPSVA
jgi:hypothetical protein